MSAIHVHVTLPVLRLGMGPYSFDPLEHLVGARVSDLLQPLMTGPMTTRRTAAGAMVDVYPLALPEGQGASVPLGATELGFFNDGGVLVLSVPALVAPVIVARLGPAVVRPPRSAGRMVEVAVRLQRGSRVGFPVGGLGEIAVEVVGNSTTS